ncbi:MAG: hypothetical protein AAGC85_09720 [Bacteroidota bacterium]
MEKHNNYDQKLVISYLEGKLSRVEEKTFTERLAQDEALQQLLWNYSTKPLASAGIPLKEDQPFSEQFQEFGPLQEPKLSGFEKAQFYTYDNPVRVGLMAAAVVILASLVFVLFPTPEAEINMADYRFQAYCPGTAGASAPTSSLEEVSLICCSADPIILEPNRLEELISLSGDPIVAYYLGHYFLEKGEYNSAKTYLQKSLSLKDELAEYSFFSRFQENSLRFNLILAEWGAGESKEDTEMVLKEFIAQHRPRGELLEKANQLLEELK